MLFKNIVGHKKQIHRIKNAIKNKKLTHASLFCGPEGIGKKKTALAIISYLNCQNPNTEDVESCGSCGSCLRIQRDNQPDLFVITDAEGSIKIEQVRHLVSKLSLKNVNTNYKCVIINNCETLTPEAANSLLKVIEEPTDNTIFFLITSNEHRILETIKSRSQKIVFQGLTDSELLLLYQHHSESLLPVKEVLPFAAGSFSKLLLLTGDDDVIKELEDFKEVITAMTEKHTFDILYLSKIFEKDKTRLERFLEYYSYYLEQSLQTNEDKKMLVLPELEAYQVAGIIDLITTAREMMARNINSRFVAERVLLQSKKIIERN